jgi:HEAT repeat protein
LSEMDGMVTAWNNLLLSARRGADQQKFRVLDEKISHRAAKDLRVFLEELETGPARNRQVSAMALGFSRSIRALAPLLAALEDRVSTVRANAAFGLGLLRLSDTPLGGLIAMYEAEDSGERGSASWAISELIKGGADGTPAKESARHGLFDTEPSVQVHSVMILARLGDSESMGDMSLLLTSDRLLVFRAASRSITKLGADDPHAKGRAARILTAALLENKEGPKRESLLRDLQVLAKSNYGDEDLAWIEWANRLPQG